MKCFSIFQKLIRSRQAEYYNALGKADKSTDSAVFVELMLDIIYSTLKDMENVSRSTDQVSDQDTDQDDNISRLTKIMGDKEMSAAEIMNELGLSHRPTFRKNYLAPALEKGIIERTIPDKPNSKNQKYRKVKQK